MHGPRDTVTKWSKSESETNITWYHLHVESKMRHRGTRLWKRKRLADAEQTCMATGESGGEGRTGRLRCADANCYLQTGYTVRSYCVAQRTVLNILWQIAMENNMKKNIHICIYTHIWTRQWQPTPVLLPGKSHGQGSLLGCSPWGLWESDMIERLHFHF